MRRARSSVHPVHATAVAACRSGSLGLGQFDHQSFGGEKQSGNGSRSLQGSAGYLGRVDHASLHQVLELTGCRVITEVLILRLEDLGDNDRALFACVGDDLAQRLFQSAKNDLSADLLVPFELLDQFLDSRHGADQGHSATGDDACLDCSARYELDWVRIKMDAGNGCAPDCPDCGGFIKTATISFGQAMPDAAMQRASDLSQACDLFLAIGSSLSVMPAAGFPLMAKRHGARLVIINREATEFDAIADLVVRQDIGTVLEPLIVH